MKLKHNPIDTGTGWGGLPDCVADSMCSTCGGVFAPGINCRVRVRHRSLASPGAKSKRSKKSTTAAATASSAAGRKRPRKYRNEVVRVCVFFSPCQFLSSAFFISLPLSGNAHPGSHSRVLSPVLTTVRVLHFYREKISALSSLVDSRRILVLSEDYDTSEEDRAHLPAYRTHEACSVVR